MFITKCNTCGVDVKLKKEIRYAVSCRSCYSTKAIDYQLNNPSSVGYLGRVLDKLGK